MSPIALLSVSNKQGLVPLARCLSEEYGYQIISSGGTAKTLQSEKIPVTRVADYTGASEILGGRVKTLHPKIHGGILARREDPFHKSELEKEGIQQIDLVVVNLYPFKETISKQNVNWEDAIENIDIGGPTLIRAAAKNHHDVIILTRPDQYKTFLNKLSNGEITHKYKRELSINAFEHTAEYDLNIYKWMSQREELNSSDWNQSVPLKQSLRYGENPHQKADWYSFSNRGWGNAIQLQGKELSTNNLLDLESAISTIKEFGYGESGEKPYINKAAVVIKHCNPCGVAIAESGSLALKKALESDRMSAFGGIVALNSCVQENTAIELTSLFLECVVAPDFDEDSKKILAKKQNLRVLQLRPESINNLDEKHIRSIAGGLLIQDIDNQELEISNWEIVTQSKPKPQELEDLKFAWKVVRHIKSNAISIASKGQSLGIGAGQMNRVGSAKLALEAAGQKASGAVLASDGFFPFDDTVRLAAEYGITSIIQPGGSIKDKESIYACNELNISMIFTGIRHFLH